MRFFYRSQNVSHHGLLIKLFSSLVTVQEVVSLSRIAPGAVSTDTESITFVWTVRGANAAAGKI